MKLYLSVSLVLCFKIFFRRAHPISCKGLLQTEYTHTLYAGIVRRESARGDRTWKKYLQKWEGSTQRSGEPFRLEFHFRGRA